MDKKEANLDLLRPIEKEHFKFAMNLDGCLASSGNCRKAIVLWATLKPSFEESSLNRQFSNPFMFIEEALETLLFHSQDAFTVTIGNWQGTTKDFRDSDLRLLDISKAHAEGRFIITRKEESCETDE